MNYKSNNHPLEGSVSQKSMNSRNEEQFVAEQPRRAAAQKRADYLEDPSPIGCISKTAEGLGEHQDAYPGGGPISELAKPASKAMGSPATDRTGRASDGAEAPENLAQTLSYRNRRQGRTVPGGGSAARWVDGQYRTAQTAQKGRNPVVGEPMVFRKASNYFECDDD